jgi:hypothetical protein
LHHVSRTLDRRGAVITASLCEALQPAETLGVRLPEARGAIGARAHRPHLSFNGRDEAKSAQSVRPLAGFPAPPGEAVEAAVLRW